jgi:hypothetical protein
MKSRYLLNPSLSKSNSNEFFIAHFAMRLNWHKIYDHVPTLEQNLSNESSDILRKFVQYCVERNIPLNWQKHIMLLYWMKNNDLNAYYNNTIIRFECLKACAAAWAANMYIDLKAIRMIIVDNISNQAIGVIRPIHFPDNYRLIKMGFENKSEIGIDNNYEFKYGISVKNNDWEIQNWKQI